MKQKGFTIVELLIVIVVIGILAAMTVVAFNGIQSRARDSERSSDISNIHKSLERFHVINNRYPTIVEIRNNPSALLSVSDDTLRVGNGPLINYCMADNTERYCYVPRDTSPGPAEDCGYTDPTKTCEQYYLTYRTESNPGSRITIDSLNK